MPLLCSFCLAVIVTIHYPPLGHDRLVVYIAVFLFMLLLARRYRLLRPALFGMAAGVLYSHLFVMQRIDNVLPHELEQQDLAVKIQITSLVEDRGHYARTKARVVGSPLLENVLLNWYGDTRPEPCQTWQVTIRLKRPHGLANPGAFDYALYLLEQGVQGKGYVREGRRLSTDKHCLNRLRSDWHDYLLKVLPKNRAAWLMALSTGDKSRLTREQYRLLQLAGINHLFVISGLHIGLAAGLAWALVLGLRRIGGGLLIPGDWRPVASIVAIMAAIAYAALAGFTLPAQRAVIMVVVFLAASIMGVTVNLWLRFWLAMALILLINPLAASNIGFALSFAAVAILLLSGHSFRPGDTTRLGRLGWLWRTQWMIAIGLSPLLFAFFGQASLLAPVINLFAIPLVSLLIVPLVLLAFISWWLFGSAATTAWLAGFVVEKFLSFVAAASVWLKPLLAPIIGWTPHPGQWLVATCIAALLLMPRIVPGRLLFVGLLVPVLLLAKPPGPESGGMTVDIIDVGQGLSVLVRTQHHALLYDTGAAWDSGSMAEFAVLPVLKQRGVSQLDRLVISHFDNDHAGGRHIIKDRLPVADTMASTWRPDVDRLCRQGQSWQWDGVKFMILHPQDVGRYSQNNDQSCVLLLEAAGRQVLIPGDIGRDVEAALLASTRKQSLKPSLLVAPHHGSHSSSSWALVKRSKGAGVVFSTGYRNRYHHPAAEVVERYRHQQARLFDTAAVGLVHARITPQGQLRIQAFRHLYDDYSDLLYSRPAQ